MFNVGEIVILEDGSVKSKEALAVFERRKAEKEALKTLAPEDVPKKGIVSKTQQQKKARLEPRPPPLKPVIPGGITLPEGEVNFISMWDITDEQIQKRLSEEKRKKSSARSNLRREQKAQKKINKAMKLLKRQTENRGEKWDQIEGRKIVMKAQEGDASEEDSQESSEDNDSENEDQDIEEIEEADEVNETQKVEKPVESAPAVQESKKSKNTKKKSDPASSGDVADELVAPIKESHPQKAKSSKRAAEDDPIEEPKAKKSKKSKKSQISDKKPEEAVEASGTSGASENATTIAAPDLEKEAKGKQALKEERRALKAQQRAAREEEIGAEKESQKGLVNAGEPKEDASREEKRDKKESRKEAAKASQANSKSEKKPKKRKHEDDEADTPVKKEKSKRGKHDDAIEALAENEKPHKQKRNRVVNEAPSEALSPSLNKQDKYYTPYTKADEEPVKQSVVAAQRNPEALTGEAARKEKFLRLLGAGKAKAAPDDGTKHKSSATEVDIRKVQSDLERQYEAGMKMKHDGGGKRRGLGA
jgi:hypothetical protein